jgi:hypothetical protein
MADANTTSSPAPDIVETMPFLSSKMRGSGTVFLGKSQSAEWYGSFATDPSKSWLAAIKVRNGARYLFEPSTTKKLLPLLGVIF